MPSHAYFYAADANPFQGPDDELVDTPEQQAVRDTIIAAITAEFEDAGYWRRDALGFDTGFAGDLELLVGATYVHVRLPWYGMAEAEERQLVPNLRRFERVLRESVGFDAFEHGCQGLHIPGDIDLVPVYLAGMQSRITDLFSPGMSGVDR